MTRMVFDASVVTAILKKEPGADIGERYIDHACLNVVNYAEITTVLARQGHTNTAIRKAVAPFIKCVVPMEPEMAFLAGTLESHTKPYGLSLSDRACLALAIIKKLPVLTGDTIWAELDLPVKVSLIR